MTKELSKKEKKRLYMKQYYEDHKEEFKQYSKQYYEDNEEHKKQYYIDNKEKIVEQHKQYKKQYYMNNKALDDAAHAERRALKLDQTPELNDNDRLVIKLLYSVREQFNRINGVAYHVDHIIPLSKGGLHEPYNLQVVPAIENLRKNDSLTYIIPRELCFRIEDLIEAIKDKISIERI